jgi:fibronectin type 3 domain-containing protein
MKMFLFVMIVGIALAPAASANTPGKHSVSLAWTASTTAGVTYNIYRGTAAGVCAGTPTPYAAAVAGTSFNDQNVSSGSTYFYAVSAVGTGGESACTTEVSAPIPQLPAPPSAPSATVN